MGQLLGEWMLQLGRSSNRKGAMCSSSPNLRQPRVEWGKRLPCIWVRLLVGPPNMDCWCSCWFLFKDKHGHPQKQARPYQGQSVYLYLFRRTPSRGRAESRLADGLQLLAIGAVWVGSGVLKVVFGGGFPFNTHFLVAPSRPLSLLGL